MTHSVYAAKLADVYDAIYSFKDYERESRFVLDKIRRYRPGAKTLLETACGTGRFLEGLRQELTVVGQDLSPAMLARASMRLPDVELHLGDMTDFSLPARFDVVCCLFRSIGYVRTRERFASAVACMARHVAADGILMIEPFFTPESFRVGKLTSNQYRDDGMSISWMYTSEKPVDALGVYPIHYLVGTDTVVEHFTETHEFGLFTPADYGAAFAAAGLAMTFDPDGPSGTGLYIGKRTNDRSDDQPGS